MSIPRDCKRLIEVDFPIRAVSAHSAREKSLRHGNPSTLHLWWARRPLAACRAVLLCLLLPDPCDPLCPLEFKEKARKAIAGITEPPKTDQELRRALLGFIANFAAWEASSDTSQIRVARAFIRAAHGDEPPLVVDPFAGGGSIPMEALRLGCDAFASDLNPVACLILKVMLEDIPRHGLKMADELETAGAKIRAAAEERLSEFYPTEPDGTRPIGYLWARTVHCEAPNCGAEIPLARSFWLCKRGGRKVALRYRIIRRPGERPGVEFEVFEPKEGREVPIGTVSLAKATCAVCGSALPPTRVRAQLSMQKGGADVTFDQKGHRIGGARLIAVVTSRLDKPGRQYRLPETKDYQAVLRAQRGLKEIERNRLPNGLSLIPDEPLPTPLRRAFTRGDPYFNFTPVLNYGITSWGDLFTARQKIALSAIAELIRGYAVGSGIEEAVRLALACSLSRLADKNASLAVWNRIGEKIEHVFGRQALSFVWDFAEVGIFSDSTGNYQSGVNLVREVVEFWARAHPLVGQAQQGDARSAPLPDDSCEIWLTDPPYYDAVPYADLSDFFYVWLKRAVPGHPILRDPFDPGNSLTPKREEIIDSLELLRGVEKSEAKRRGIPIKDRDDFERAITRVFLEGRRVLKDDGMGCVVFAHKTTEGWEAILSGIIQGGWVITGSWPLATERPGRLRSQESAALATSIHLVCRPRPENAVVGDWANVMHELPERVGDWMERLQSEGVRGADLVFACIGPALEIFSRYSKVETAEGHEVSLAEYLEKVWEIVGRSALEQVLGAAKAETAGGTAVGLEEDARLTALFLWTLQSTEVAVGGGEAEEVGSHESDESEEGEGEGEPRKGGYALPFDIARRFAQPLGIHLDAWEGRVIETKKGIVRLLSLSERVSPLFGGKGSEAVAAGAQRLGRGPVQTKLFPQIRSSKEGKEKGRMEKRPAGIPSPPREMTTLDRVHAAMLLQTSGQSGALREFFQDEMHRGPQFLRLANALSALYPRESEEKRLLDAVLLMVPRR